MIDTKLLSAWCHFPIFLGPFLPLFVIVFYNKDPKLVLNAKQALVWQVLSIAVLFALGILMALVPMMLMLFVGLALGGLGGVLGGLLATMVSGLFFFGVYFLAIGVVTITMIYAAFKAYSTGEYRYPVVGKLIN
jgi:uncharacterized Tic20 family protein